MDVQVEFLISSVEKSLTSLKDKRDFLEEQKLQYNNIHDRLITFKSEQTDINNKDIDDTMEQKGMIMGDVIISANKCFLNVGYEYYIEKPCDEIIEFINDKLNLMVEALEQFHLKINEAQETLKNLKQVAEKQQHVIDETEVLKSGNVNDDLLPEFDTEFPTMEIREELDEDGNVINSSVRPTRESSSKNKKDDKITKKIEPVHEDTKQIDDFESNLKGKLLPHEDKKHEEIQSNHNEIATENIYSFADLVQQMDDEDGEFNEDDIEYDYDRFNNHMENLNINDDDSDEYDDGMFNGHMNIVPGMSGQSSFMDQIAKLRAQRNGIVEPEQKLEEIKKTPVKPIKKSADIQVTTKPILKPESDFSEEAEIKRQMEKEKKKKDTKKKKKSVGFAAQLDIHEVESFKEETKKQTHRLFPTAQQLMFSNLVGVKDEDMVDDTNNPKLHEFDSDLFASMLGVKGPEEIHDKYSNIVEKEVEEEEIKSQEHIGKKKTRVSRFRKDKLVKKPEHHMKNQYNNTNDIVERDIIEDSTAVSDTIVEHDIVERDIIANEPVINDIVEKAPVVTENIVEHDIVEREPVVSDIVEREPVVSDIVEREPVVSDIVEREPVVSDIVEREPVVSDIVEREPVVSDIMEREPVVEDIVGKNITDTPIINKTSTPSKKHTSLFNKKFNSLQTPSSNIPTKPPIITQEMLDAYEPEEDLKEPKIVELKGEEGDEEEIFPDEIKDAIHKMGKTEDNMHVANVDYMGLNDNLDDMVKAYSLGLYDDDLEEHPGTVLEKVEDFKSYNKEVETLSEEIKEFKKENPMEGEIEEMMKDDDNKIMSDTILERDIPEDYNNDDITKDVIDDYGLDSDNLQASVVSEYYKLKQTILPKLQAEIESQSHSHSHSHNHTHTHSQEDGIEPVDSEGNPIKLSKFKSQRLQLNL